MTWDVSNYSANPALNPEINGIDISEGSAAAGYNDALRQIMADIALWTATNGVTYPISVAHGGTGAVDAPTALATLGALSSAYQNLPQTAESAGFTYGLTMMGGHVRYTGAGTSASITTNAVNAFPIGATILTINDGSGALSIVPSAGVVLVWGATGATGTRSLAAGGMATLIQVATDRWFIAGSGLS